VMRSDERAGIMEMQRQLVAELFASLVASEGRALDATFRADFDEADDDAARTRVVVDQIASLTDASAVTWHQRLTARAST
jgi:dGTPase